MTALVSPIQPHELDPAMRRGLDDLVRRVSARAVVEGRGSDLLLRIYLAGLYHGDTLSPKVPR